EVVPRRVLIGGGGDPGWLLTSGAVPAAAQRARLPQVHSGRWQGGGQQVSSIAPRGPRRLPSGEAPPCPRGGPSDAEDERRHQLYLRYSSMGVSARAASAHCCWSASRMVCVSATA